MSLYPDEPLQPLTIEELRLLRSILARRSPSALTILSKVGSTKLSEDEREALRAAVGEELAATGYRGTVQSDAVGAQLDDLIDRLGHV